MFSYKLIILCVNLVMLKCEDQMQNTTSAGVISDFPFFFLPNKNLICFKKFQAFLKIQRSKWKINKQPIFVYVSATSVESTIGMPVLLIDPTTFTNQNTTDAGQYEVRNICLKFKNKEN